MIPIQETRSFHNVKSYLERAGSTPSYEVLNGLEGIVNGIARGEIFADPQEIAYFQVLLELYKTHFGLSRSFDEIQGTVFPQNPKYASAIACAVVNTILDYEKILTGKDPGHKRSETAIKEEDFDGNVIAKARSQFGRFKNYIVRASKSNNMVTKESADALSALAGIYKQASQEDVALGLHYLFFRTMSELAQHQLRLKSTLGKIGESSLSSQLEKYDFGQKILDIALTTVSKYYDKVRS